MKQFDGKGDSVRHGKVPRVETQTEWTEEERIDVGKAFALAFCVIVGVAIVVALLALSDPVPR